MTATPPRRWFRFSLRTLFVVVTVVCVGLGWEVNQVRERKEVVRLLKQKNVRRMNVEVALAPSDPSWSSRYFGDVRVMYVTFPQEHEATLYDLLVRTRAAFPKVEIYEFVMTDPDSGSLEKFYGKNGELKPEPAHP